MKAQQAPETTEAYLKALRLALKGAPRGLIADALADCEEHLNNERLQNPDVPEAELLARIVETYGAPEEIAGEYRDLEAEITAPRTPFPQSPDQIRRGDPEGGFFGVLADARTYGALLYMMLALFLGLFYFAWTVCGLMITAGCAVLIFGIPFALLFIGSIRMLSHLEGRVVESLLGVRMPRRLPVATADEGLLARIRDAVLDIRTWTSMFYLLLMLPLGLIYFTVALAGLSVSLVTPAVAVYDLFTDQSHFRFDAVPWLNHMLQTAPGLIVLAALGLILFVVLLHIVRAIGWLHGRIAEGLLVRL